MSDLIAKLDALAEKAQPERVIISGQGVLTWSREALAAAEEHGDLLNEAWPTLRAELLAAREVCAKAEAICLEKDICAEDEETIVACRILGMSPLQASLAAWRAARTNGGGS